MGRIFHYSDTTNAKIRTISPSQIRPDDSVFLLSRENTHTHTHTHTHKHTHTHAQIHTEELNH